MLALIIRLFKLSGLFVYKGRVCRFEDGELVSSELFSDVEDYLDQKRRDREKESFHTWREGESREQWHRRVYRKPFREGEVDDEGYTHYHAVGD